MMKGHVATLVQGRVKSSQPHAADNPAKIEPNHPAEIMTLIRRMRIIAGVGIIGRLYPFIFWDLGYN